MQILPKITQMTFIKFAPVAGVFLHLRSFAADNSNGVLAQWWNTWLVDIAGPWPPTPLVLSIAGLVLVLVVLALWLLLRRREEEVPGEEIPQQDLQIEPEKPPAAEPVEELVEEAVVETEPEASQSPEPAAEEATEEAADRLETLQPEVPEAQAVDTSPALEEAPVEEDAGRLLDRMRGALARTGRGFGDLFSGRSNIDDDLLEELETQLLMADVGVEATGAILDELNARVQRKQLGDSGSLLAALHEILLARLQPCEATLEFEAAEPPFVVLVVGVNGVGKTTTIGKLAARLQAEGKSIMLAAGDTFRAAAVEQLVAWGERHSVPVVAQQTGADSASVIFDAIQSARAKSVDVLIADTAGRLHNKSNLMEELNKVRRVAGKLDPSAPHETLLVLDAGTGQNAVSQMQEFSKAGGVTGIVLTKLDGTAKGGVIFALAEKFKTPVRFIGVGEATEDLQPFVAADFVDALLSEADAAQ